MGRAPHGARGLKFEELDLVGTGKRSRPARGAWIEILFMKSATASDLGRAPHGARGLKFCLHKVAAHPLLDVAPRTGRVD